MRGGGNIQLLLVKVTGLKSDLDAFYGVPHGQLPEAVEAAGFGESDYSKPYLKRDATCVEFMMSGGWRIYDNVEELLVRKWPQLTFEVQALDVDAPDGRIYTYKGRRKTVKRISEKALPLYTKCVFGPHDFGNARRLTRKARGRCFTRKLKKGIFNA